MLGDYEALFRAILEEVDNDLPRLVFADYLEESGHPASAARAAFIRLQIEEEQQSHPFNRFTQLIELRRHFHDEWDETQRQQPCLAEYPLEYEYRRGFLDTLSIDYLDVLDLANNHVNLWDVAPITRLSFVYGSHSARASAGVANFDVYQLSHAATWHDFWQQPARSRLREVTCIRAGDAARALGLDEAADHPSRSLALIQPILDAPALTRLRQLALVNCDLHDLALVRLLSLLKSSPCFAHLQSLNLRNNPLSHYAAHALAAFDWPPQFHTLKLSPSHLSPAAHQSLARQLLNRPKPIQLD